MQVVVKGLLGLALLSVLASCRVDLRGLGAQDASLVDIEVPGPDASSASGAAGAIQPAVDASGIAGQPGVEPSGAATGEAGTTGSAGMPAASAGTSGEAGDSGGAGTGAAGAGEAGTGAAGSGEAGTGAAGSGAAGTGMAGSGGPAGAGAAGSPAETPDAHPVSKVGCADGTREGFIDEVKYPTLAACSGGWDVPGLVDAKTRTPQCQRHAGNSGTGAGCSVADLCAEGWHVCESIAEFKLNATSCTDGYSPSGGTPVFFATRQHGSGSGTVTCDPKNTTDGTNNLYGCGNIGSPADQTCQPFTRMLRDNDCKNNRPWTCEDGQLNYNVLELADVTKPGAARGGVLCCR